jgi:hypothetical protein
MRIARRHHTDRRWHHPSPATTTGQRGHSGHTGQPPADRFADAIILLWGLR